jgi:hypothetical protein
MSSVTRRDKINTEIMEPHLTQNTFYYVETTVEQVSSWRCDGCGLVWEKKWHAESCENRDHKTSFEQRYGGTIVNGKHVGYRAFVRKAMRREKV